MNELFNQGDLIMNRNMINTVALVLVCALFPSTVLAQAAKNVKLHVNPAWKQCSFQLDPALTQDAWEEFTREAGLVAYFRSLSDAKPIGVGNYELSMHNWGTAIDDSKSDWNDTFVHPDSAHWLIEGEQLGFPGLTFRTGITKGIDVGAYWAKNSQANYGFWGGQVQYNFVNDLEKNLAASARISFISMYGPEDLDLTVYGLDLVASREYTLFSDWRSVSAYAGVSTYLSRSHEKTNTVNLQDENILGVRGMVGAVAQVSIATLAVEYNFAAVNSLSFKLGIGF